MLKLTKKADYGLMALKYLAEHPETPALSAKDVADAYGIPAQLLAKILQQLTKSGLLRSHAGMNGGYALAREARAISAYEVILAIDGPFFITSCTKGKSGCELTTNCTIKEPLARVNETIAGVLKSISIQDLAEHEHAAGQANRDQVQSAAGLVSVTL
jgi:Rrf2 family protein